MKIAQLSKDGEDFYPVIGSEGLANVIPVTKGGTGANNADDARTNLNISDSVIEQDTSGIWTYRKWSSGIVEFYGKYSGTHTHYNSTNSWYAWYIDGDSSGSYYDSKLVYPFKLNSLLNYQYTCAVDSSFSIAGSSLGANTSYAILRPFSTVSGSQLIEAYIYVVGTWK